MNINNQFVNDKTGRKLPSRSMQIRMSGIVLAVLAVAISMRIETGIDPFFSLGSLVLSGACLVLADVRQPLRA